MRSELFDFITMHLREQSGLTLTPEKTYLLESRLQPIARSHGHATVEELLGALMQKRNDTLMHDIIQAMTTNETMFFRDNKPFDRLRETILPELVREHSARQPFRVWSAACSTGQEPYTIAMCLQEDKFRLGNASFDIVATDLCERALDKAQKASYSQFEVQRGLPIQLLIKYFIQQDGNSWQVNPATRDMVRFKQFNLMESFAPLGSFDIVFCRNVLLYFDENTKRQVLEKIANLLRPPGYLVLGSAETVIGLTDRFKMHSESQGIYTLAR